MGLIPIYTVYILSGIDIYSDFRIYFIIFSQVECWMRYLNGAQFSTYYISLIHFPCICPDLSGYDSVMLYVRDPDQDEMDGCCVCY